MKINITGDFCITPEHLDKNLLDEDIIKYFDNSDLNIINLKCPIAENNDKQKILKTGPNLQTDTKIINESKKLNIDVVTLANNHILDFGNKALENTFESCHNNGILSVGAVVNLNQASKPLIIEREGIKIAIVNFCEHEWSVATSTNVGANPLDIIDNPEIANQIGENGYLLGKQKFNYLVYGKDLKNFLFNI